MPITFDLQVIHGAAGVWPTGHTTVSAGATIADPAVATAANGGASGGSFVAGSYTLTYTFVGANGETLPSPPVTAAISGTQALLVTPPVLVARAHAYRLYLDDSPGGTRRLLYEGTSQSVQTFAAAPATTAAAEPTANTTAEVPLRWGRADDEHGNVPVPIPQVAPTSVYSWPKTFRASVAPQGTAPTTITNLSVGLDGPLPPGLRLYARAVPGADNPASLPTVNANVGSGPYLPAGTWKLAYTYVTDAGETAPLQIAGATVAQTIVATGSHVYTTNPLTLPTTNPLPIRSVRWYVSEAVGSTVLRRYAENGGESLIVSGPGTGVVPPVIGGYLQASGANGTTMGLTPPDDPTPRAGANPNTPAGYAAVGTADQPTIWDPRSFSGNQAGPFGFLLSLVVGVADKSSLAPTTGITPLPDLIISMDES